MKKQETKINRRDRRASEREEKKAALKDEAFKEGVRQAIRCSGSITTEEVYKGIIQAIAAGHAELAIISESENLNYFTNLNLMPLFNVISDAAEHAAEEFNKKVYNEIEKAKNVN